MPTASFEVLTAHNQEVCGLKWKNDARVVASGGNDNKVVLWENQGRRMRAELRGHQAAVKAICWMEGVEGGIITGGGTADMTMKYLFLLLTCFKECGMLKQDNYYKTLTQKAKFVHLHGHNSKRR